MLFGIKEIYEYEKICDDPKVLYIIKQWRERGSKLSKLTEENIRLQQIIKTYKKENIDE